MNTEVKTRRFLSRVLRDHYRSVDLYLPYRFTRREFAFVYMGGKGMHRPVGFSTRKEASDFLIKKTPLHAYYSTAYYSDPKVPMKNKEWLGADLVFDLDADHLPGGDQLTYPEQLKEVKKKTQLLVHDFLLDDFGIDENELYLYFSGHRGYHIHIRNRKVLQMSSQARREIVDYITGIGLDLEVILPYENIKIGQFKDIDNIKKALRLPDEKEGGWRKKTRKLTFDLLERWNKRSKEKVIEEMEEKHGVGPKTASGLYEDLFTRDKWKTILESGVLDVFSENQRMVNASTFKKIIEGVLKEENVLEIGSKIIGTTDEPVTGDIKRLIRLPTSIHGGSFLKVTPIQLDEFDGFDPLKEAVPECLSCEKKDLVVDKLPRLETIDVAGETIEFKREMRVTEAAAPFIISKFGAKLL
ncbi:MAG: DNA primase catalytic subunit PriS [Candidatus Saliniplasma sp.]